MKRQYTKEECIKNYYETLDKLEIRDADLSNVLDDAIEYEYRGSITDHKYNLDSLEKILINSIRHNYSNYDELLRPAKRNRKASARLNYIQYKNYTLEQISKKYPYLKDGCDKQKSELNMVTIDK